MKPSILAVIPARGGSKRIPRKNLRDFCGKPILSYSIRAALGAGIFDEVMVSTDDAEIAEVAKREGAAVPFLRSKENSGDHATTADVLTEVLDRYRGAGREFTAYCCIYPTAPFVTPARLKAGLELLLKGGAESVVPVVAFGFPIQRAFEIRQGRLGMVHPEFMQTRSQDLPPRYHDCGQFYFGNMSAFSAQRKLFLDPCLPLVTSELEAQDIDTEEDWRIAELKFQLAKR